MNWCSSGARRAWRGTSHADPGGLDVALLFAAVAAVRRAQLCGLSVGAQHHAVHRPRPGQRAVAGLDCLARRDRRTHLRSAVLTRRVGLAGCRTLPPGELPPARAAVRRGHPAGGVVAGVDRAPSLQRPAQPVAARPSPGAGTGRRRALPRRLPRARYAGGGGVYRGLVEPEGIHHRWPARGLLAAGTGLHSVA